jgi:hypothetical protein
MMKAPGKLTNLQVELLKVFQYDLEEHQLEEIRELLTKYFAQKATEEMDKLWDDNQWSDETMKQWANEHLRTKSDK